ncbi:MAG: hypothetical protein AAGD32_01835 [Planctomycetota bacterium]
MKHTKLFVGVLLGVGATVAIAQVPDNPEPVGKLPKLYKPYSLMETLDTKTILAIDKRHDETLAAIKQLKQAEYDDIQAMLNDEQKAELAEIESQLKAERDAYIAERQKKKLEERMKEKEDAGE